MFKTFTWDPKNDQVYTPDYGSQFSSVDSSSGIDKSEGKTFTLNAGYHQYVVKPYRDAAFINWDDSSLIEVKSGRFLLDFSRTKDTPSTITTSNIKVGGVSQLDSDFEIHGCSDFISNGTISITSNGTVDINALQLHFRFGNTYQSVELEGNARLSVSANYTSDTNGHIHGPVILNDESYAELKASSLMHEKNSIYNIKGNAELWIHANEIKTTQSMTVFNLHAGKSQISICGFTNEYCDISSLGKDKDNTPKACFNFIKTDGKNESQVILACTFEPDTVLPAALMFWLGANEMLWINGTPSDTNQFNFNYDNHFLVISLKN